jgi:hypothetical protein
MNSLTRARFKHPSECQSARCLGAVRRHNQLISLENRVKYLQQSIISWENLATALGKNYTTVKNPAMLQAMGQTLLFLRTSAGGVAT